MFLAGAIVLLLGVLTVIGTLHLRPAADLDRPAHPAGGLIVADTDPGPRSAHRTVTPSPAALQPEETSGPTAPAIQRPARSRRSPRPASRS